MQPDVTINKDRLWDGIEDLARLTDPDRPFTRRAFSALFGTGREYLAERFRKAGLAVRIDPAGNLIGRREGTVAGRAPILVGSHSDTVPDGGRFDGVAGVLTGLEVAEALAEQRVSLRHPLEVVDFLAEEPSPYGPSCVGSRAMAGALTSEMLEAKAPDGSTLAEGIRRVGGDPDRLAGCRRQPGDIAGFFELHIEQGPILEAEGIPVGIVTDIVGITRVEVSVVGQAAHSGTTPMAMRRDALVGASKIVLLVEQQAAETAKSSAGFVATVGRMSVAPNGANVVPGKVALTVEVRSGTDERRHRFIADVLSDARRVLSEVGLGLDVQPISDSAAVRCDDGIVRALADACQTAGVGYRRMPSGAGHDAAYMARLGPSGMVFIPCRQGMSHRPEEWADPDHLALGAQMLSRAVLMHDAETD